MKKKFYLMMAVVMLLSVVLASTAFADTKTVTGAVGGYATRGVVSCGSSGGGARTEFATTGGVRVTLKYTYIEGGTTVRSTTIPNSAYGTSVSVSAGLPSGLNNRSESSKGTFNVTYGSGSWTDSETAFY